MTDLLKTDLLPDDFLGLFNIPGMPAGQPVGMVPQPGVPQTLVPAPVSDQPAVGSVQLPVAPQYAAPAVPAQVAALVPQHLAQPQPVVVAPAPQPVQAVVSPSPAPPLAAPAVGQEFLLQQQNAQLQAQLSQLQANEVQAVAAARQQEIQAMPKQDQMLARMELLERQNNESIKRAQQWQVEARKRELIAQTGGEVEEGQLDTRSLEALEASLPMAQRAYQVRENEMFQKFARQMGLQNQVAVEGLPPAPQSSVGFPSSNQGGAVVTLPQAAVPQVAHPQLGRDNAYDYMGVGAGRVFQPQPGAPVPQPNAQGQYFPGTYPQPGAVAPVVQAPQIPMNQPVPNNAAAYQNMLAQQQQAVLAPTPDPSLRADGSSQGRALAPQEQYSAVNAARASVAASRQSGMSGAMSAGLRENRSNTQALKGGATPITLASLPIPGADTGVNHPQYLAGARVA